MNPIEQKFRKKSNSIKITPSPASWEALRKRLDKKKRRNPIKMNIWLTAVASILGLIIFLGVIFISHNPNTKATFKASPAAEVRSSKDSTELNQHLMNTQKTADSLNQANPMDNNRK